MSYLARLKQDIGQVDIPLLTSVGFVGVSTQGFPGSESYKLPNFSTERKKNVLNQFYVDRHNRHNGGPDESPQRETRLGLAPTQPTKRSVDTSETWRRAFYLLNSTEAPCPGFRLSMDWRQTYDAAHAFLEQHAEQAHALGWDTLDLFAVHRTVGGTRVDCCGCAMLMAGSEVLSIDRDVIALRRAHDGQPCGRFFRVPHTPEMIPVWSFGR